MRRPKDQTDLFRLFSIMLYYMVNGNIEVGYLVKNILRDNTVFR